MTLLGMDNPNIKLPLSWPKRMSEWCLLNITVWFWFGYLLPLNSVFGFYHPRRSWFKYQRKFLNNFCKNTKLIDTFSTNLDSKLNSSKLSCNGFVMSITFTYNDWKFRWTRLFTHEFVQDIWVLGFWGLAAKVSIF